MATAQRHSTGTKASQRLLDSNLGSFCPKLAWQYLIFAKSAWIERRHCGYPGSPLVYKWKDRLRIAMTSSVAEIRRPECGEVSR
jgi:hypothetical protein